MLKYMSEAALSGKVKVRTDSELAIAALAQGLMQARAPQETILETTPVSSSSSLGLAERYAETLESIVRTQAEVVKRLWKKEITTKSPLLSWCIRHSSWLHNRFQPHRSTGRTAYAQIHQRNYESEIFQFSACVLGLCPASTEMPKLEQRWR